ncbi:tensin-3 [Drosophila sulfurigaster albostrigata]|uniref:tensin-3 n=1 Tax=Drosophila sulfurigaster albostrigata TaxID=89887 RepID=UPI002D21BABA|nr:tensin-3 [Drosophila sulfurigaster albostrigata]
MRSQYEDSAAVSTDSKYHTSYSYNSSNNNNNNYHNGNGNGIPYHARENSLPFSYGIATTSTPLRKTPTPTRADSFLDFDYGIGSGNKSTSNNNVYNNNNNNHQHHNNNNNSSSSNNNSNGDMIKPQPRLTSPLLVRKTLGSRNPTTTTATNTNTISNTYHYGGGTTSATATPPRADFEQLLRERRDKVYNEYRSKELVPERVPPTPPQRRQSNSYNNGQQSKYNYDFEFNLNLDDVSEQRSPLPYHTRNIEVDQRQRQSQPQLHQDMDVPDGAIRGGSRRLESTIVERNYHTINNGYSKNNYNSLERPPMEVTHKRLQQQQQQQQQQLEHIYGQNQLHLETQQQQTRSRRDLSPIYATSSKRTTTTTTTTNAAAAAPNSNGQADYLLTTPSPTSRPETPAFPVTPRTPFATGSGSISGQRISPTSESIYQTMGPRQPVNSTPSPTFEVAADLVKFARNSAKFWYKATLSREDAIALLLNAPPGTFLVRDSTTYKNAYGLVLRVAQPPAGSQELVRHFLIEPTQRGVRLKGCANEPVFTSLSALIYEHSINQLALPCLLRIPEADVVPALAATTPAQQQLLTHGAATNVLWLFSCDTESLTGNEAIRKAIRTMYEQRTLPETTEVHFKVSGQGITLTDNTRKKFFRKHYTADVISHCAIDPENRMWTSPNDTEKKTIFAFVARRSHSSKDNQCHVFCDLSVAQPAAAIVSFANRTLPTEKQRNYVL